MQGFYTVEKNSYKSNLAPIKSRVVSKDSVEPGAYFAYPPSRWKSPGKKKSPKRRITQNHQICTWCKISTVWPKLNRIEPFQRYITLERMFFTSHNQLRSSPISRYGKCWLQCSMESPPPGKAVTEDHRVVHSMPNRCQIQGNTWGQWFHNQSGRSALGAIIGNLHKTF